MTPILAGVHRVGDLLVRVEDSPTGTVVRRYEDYGPGKAGRWMPGGLIEVTGDLRERILAVLTGVPS